MNNTRSQRRRSLTAVSPLMWGLVAAFVISALVTAYLTYVAVRAVVASGRAPESPELALVDSTPQPGPDLSQAINIPLQDENGPTPQPWDGANRVTILAMGLDYRDWEAGEAARTDTMILFTVDPQTRSAGMLSIPRDLWVQIPGFEYGKINTAHYLGDHYDLPGGGPGLAIQTVEQFLGVPINYYARIDFTAFERLIDELGGLEIDVPEEITVDPIGPGNTVTLQPGLQTLDGPVALAYARNRDTFGGDFDRAARTQQVIIAIRDQVLSLDMLPTLITKSPILYKQLASGVRTNLTLEEAIRLAWLMQQIPLDSIKRGVIGIDQVEMSISPEGLDILQPKPDEIRLLRDEIFSASGPVAPAATEVDPEALMQAEAASISVLNATFTAGLAAETSDYLKSQGINVTFTGNAQETSDITTVIDYTGNPYTIQFLVELMDIQADHIYSRYDPNSEVDVAILLGDDWAEKNPLP